MAAVMLGSLLMGCGNSGDTNGNQNGASENSTENNTQSDTGNTTGGPQNAGGTGQGENTGTNQRMGLGIISTLEKTTDAGDENGSAEVSTVVAAVSVDEEDRIISCKLDAIEQKISVSNTGAFDAQAQTEYQTKKELGEDYGMQAVSGIGKEWYEQAEAFEQYVMGKTLEDINGIETDDNGYIKDDTLSTSVTISISDFQAAINKAVENAR